VPAGPSFIRWFSDLGLTDVPLAGGKNASLGELYRQLAGAGVRVPNGFAITADGYRHFMQATGLAATITGNNLARAPP
jgi:pyruvate,water dikinase